MAVSIDTIVRTERGIAKSTNGGNYEITIDFGFQKILLCDGCDRTKQEWAKHSEHKRTCPAYQAWWSISPLSKKHETRNTCDTCNNGPIYDGPFCRHFVEPDFAEVVVNHSPGDNGEWPCVNFTTTTAKLEELLPLMEKAIAWVDAHTRNVVPRYPRPGF